MVAVAVLFGLPAAVTGDDSIFIWIDVGFCLLLAAVLFVIGLRGCRSHPGRGAPAVQIGRARDKLFVLAAIVAVLSPAVGVIARLGETAIGPIAHRERECRAVPAEPSVEASPN